MRHYYDIYCLLDVAEVKEFIGTDAYLAHKQKRFPAADNQRLNENQAFILNDDETYRLFESAYKESASLYYQNQPSFKDIRNRIISAIQSIEGI